jgi:hypothetical protein
MGGFHKSTCSSGAAQFLIVINQWVLWLLAFQHSETFKNTKTKNKTKLYYRAITAENLGLMF